MPSAALRKATFENPPPIPRKPTALRHVPHSKPVRPKTISLLSVARRWIGLGGIDSFMVTEGGGFCKQRLIVSSCRIAGQGQKEMAGSTQAARAGVGHAGGQRRRRGRLLNAEPSRTGPITPTPPPPGNRQFEGAPACGPLARPPRTVTKRRVPDAPHDVPGLGAP